MFFRSDLKIDSSIRSGLQFQHKKGSKIRVHKKSSAPTFSRSIDSAIRASTVRQPRRIAGDILLSLRLRTRRNDFSEGTKAVKAGSLEA
jgi:hypothetical protein